MAAKLLLLLLALPAAAHAGEDFQYWNAVKFTHSPHSKLDLQVAFEQRFIDGAGSLATYNYAPRFVVKLHSFIDFALGYKYEREKKSGRWAEEHRMEQITRLKGRWRGIKAGLATRFERRGVPGRDKWRWREKLTLSFPAALSALRCEPYVSQEIFYDLRADTRDQNRVKLGAKKMLDRMFGLDLYYMRKDNKAAGRWTGANAIGAELLIVY